MIPNTDYDVIVVGGGVQGASVAYDSVVKVSSKGKL
jgi:glycerol-3-phosphate dehydrogenase